MNLDQQETLHTRYPDSKMATNIQTTFKVVTNNTWSSVFYDFRLITPPN